MTERERRIRDALTETERTLERLKVKEAEGTLREDGLTEVYKAHRAKLINMLNETA